MNGILHDSAKLAQDAAKMRAHLAMLAARDVANLNIKHALDLRQAGAGNFAELFDQNASTFRALERSAAITVGLGDE